MDRQQHDGVVSTFAIIPARGGSKGLPGKNLLRVGGVPLVQRTVSAALGAELIDRVIVSTDDAAIAAAARHEGADVVDRPHELASDDATSESALLHALASLDAARVPAPDIVAMLQCTSPFTTSDIIDGTLRLFDDESVSCAFTGARSHAFLWRLTGGAAIPVNHDISERLRRQDQPAEYFDTGAVYAMRTAGLRETSNRFFGRIAIYEVGAAQGLEIDTELDLEIAELLVGRSDERRPGRVLPGVVTAVAFDFDGVLTDNRVITLTDGTEGVLSDRSDGLGVELLQRAGIDLVVLSKERNAVVAARCRKLKMELVQGLDDKLTAFLDWMRAGGHDPATVVFVGNDVNDVECLAAVGCGVVVADAHPSARLAANVVLTHRGGLGAVREVADLVLGLDGGRD
jgi:N-acylneuraminate cytidylyltransferase